MKIASLYQFQICIVNDIAFKLICSLLGADLKPWNSNLHDWQNGLGWLHAICTCPQKAIVVLQNFLFRWIPCIKSMQKQSSEPRKTFSSIPATLESVIKVGQGISEGPGKFGKKNNCRAGKI